nr:hypothetical protein [Tanacetum cinerariifolium]
MAGSDVTPTLFKHGWLWNIHDPPRRHGISLPIFKDNKWSRTIALKAKLRSLKLGDLSMDAYFRKVELLATILTNLGSPEPFFDLRTAHSMLTTEEMQLKPKSQSLPVDSSSSSPMVLVAQSGNNHCSSIPQVKTSRPCYTFARGSCRFGDPCRFVHASYMQANSNNNSLCSSSSNTSCISNNEGNTTNELLGKLLGQLEVSVLRVEPFGKS